MQRRAAALGERSPHKSSAASLAARHDRVPLSPDARALGWLANVAASPDLKPRAAPSASPLGGRSPQVLHVPMMVSQMR